MSAVRGVADLLRPDVLAAVGRLDLRARILAEGFLAGRHRSLSRGFSAEFAGHRPYASGEPARAIDWTAWARTGRLYVRDFRADTSIEGTLVIDGSASMGYGPGGLTKLRYAADLCGAIAFLMSRQGDPAGLLVLGRERIEGLWPSARPGSLARLLQMLACLRAEGAVPFADSLRKALPYLRRRGIVALVSDFHPPADAPRIGRLVAQLRARGHDVILFHILDADELRPRFREPVELEDVETGRRARLDAERVRDYCALVDAWRAELARCCRERGAEYCPLDTGSSLGPALASWLERRAGR